MNCKPGDLAIVIRAGRDGMDMRGRIVTCKRVSPYFLQEPHWETEVEVWCQGSRIAFADSSLRPIRDPGDDALSEDLRPLPEVVGETGVVW